MKNTKKMARWELFFGEKPPISRPLMAFLIVVFGFITTYIIFHFTSLYLSSLTVIAVIFIALYSGAFYGIVAAVMLSVSADFFIPPIGHVFDSRVGTEHFFLVVSLAVFVAFLGSALRSAFHLIILAKEEAEHSSELMEKVLVPPQFNFFRFCSWIS